MATTDVRNVIVGAAEVFVSAKDSTDVPLWPTYALPTLEANKPAASKFEADTTNWRGVGFTTEGIEVAYSPDYGDIQVDQLLDTAKLFKQGMTVSINTTLAEATLENLLVVFAQKGSTKKSNASVPADYAGGGTGAESLGIEAGALGQEPVERSLVFIGNAPRTATGKKRERMYHIRRALNVEASSHSYRRNEATVFPVSFRLLPDSSFSGAEYGTIVDRLIEAAS